MLLECLSISDPMQCRLYCNILILPQAKFLLSLHHLILYYKSRETIACNHHVLSTTLSAIVTILLLCRSTFPRLLQYAVCQRSSLQRSSNMYKMKQFSGFFLSFLLYLPCFSLSSSSHLALNISLERNVDFTSHPFISHYGRDCLQKII